MTRGRERVTGGRCRGRRWLDPEVVSKFGGRRGAGAALAALSDRSGRCDRGKHSQVPCHRSAALRHVLWTWALLG
jgi:hypothetical protein